MDGTEPADAHVPVTAERIRRCSQLHRWKSELNLVSLGQIVELNANKIGRDKNCGKFTPIIVLCWIILYDSIFSVYKWHVKLF